MAKRINDSSSSPSKRLCIFSGAENTEDLPFPDDDFEIIESLVQLLEDRPDFISLRLWNEILGNKPSDKEMDDYKTEILNLFEQKPESIPSDIWYELLLKRPENVGIDDYFREKVSLFERRPNDTPIELWNVILDNKPSNQTFDEWIKSHSNNEVLSIIPNYEPKPSHVTMDEWNDFILTNEFFANFEWNPELGPQIVISNIEVITLDSSSDEETYNQNNDFAELMVELSQVANASTIGSNIQMVDISDEPLIIDEEVVINGNETSVDELPIIQTGGAIPNDVFQIEVIQEQPLRVSKKFDRTEYNYNIGISHNLGSLIPNLREVNEKIDEFYENVVRPILQKYNQNDWYSVFVKNRELKFKNIFIETKAIKDFDSTEFLSYIMRVAQSNQEFILNGELDIQVSVTKRLEGRGCTKSAAPPQDTAQKRATKQTIIKIKNNDNSCGYRAIYVGIKYHELEVKVKGVRHPDVYTEWRKVTVQSMSAKHQTEGTMQFCRDAGLDINTPMNMDIIADIQGYLLRKDIQIVVVDSSDHRNRKFIGPNLQKQIYLEYIDDGNGKTHYNFIKEMCAYLGNSYYCVPCNMGHNNKTHICKNGCLMCNSPIKCAIIQDLIDCTVCSRSFYNNECFNKHIENKLCLNYKKCNNCDVEYINNPKKTHKCDEHKCRICNEFFTICPHYCMLKTLKNEDLATEDAKNKIIITYDIESTQIKVDDKSSRHEPNLLISEIVCDKCWNDATNCKVIGNCDFCGVGYLEFFGKNCIKKFTDYVYIELAKKASKNKAKVYVFAHNARGYDGHFILQDLFERGFENTEIVMSGLKVLKIDVANVRLIDSLSFFQQPLSSLPKSFGLDSHVIKGYFPHFFNLEENYDYEAEVPPIEYFGVKYMKPNAANDCRIWRQSLIDANYVYNFKNELIKYCANDVKILTMSIMKFRQLFKSVTDIDPITRAFTLASVGLEYFRAKVLQENTIGITPIDGYIAGRHKSIKGNIWLDWLQRVSGKEIVREQRIGPFWADGYIPDERRAFEFLGCYYHGCETCFPNDRDSPHVKLNGLSFAEVLNKTNEKKNYYNRRHFQLTLIWEHEFDLLRVESEGLKLYFAERIKHYSKLKRYGSVCLRESFFGGRTNNLKFSYECRENEVLKYYDFTSLYPYVLVSNDYPVGHPKVISEDFGNINQYFGFIKCKILPPKQLYIPVLPVKLDKKLVFPLCSKCAISKNIDTCNHSDEERVLCGTWTSMEIQKAVTLGYEIKNVLEVLHYEKRSNEIFQPYIKTWLKIKTESSDWPKNCTTPEAKLEFIQEFYEREGVELDESKICPNSGLRFIAKLMLNSLWGKLAQRPNQSQTAICTEYGHYYKIVSDPKLVITGEIMVNPDTVIVNYKYKEDVFGRSGNTSVAISSMVTAYARLKLYDEMEKIENSKPGRVLYFDTDSIIFIHRESENWYIPPLNNFLGDMTDEVWENFKTDGAFMNKFASCGPKNYGYSVKFPNSTEKCNIKAKGICLTDEVKDELDFNVIKNFAEEYQRGNILTKNVQQQQFRANKYHQVFTSVFPKLYRGVSEKRKIVNINDNYETLPYGYVE